MDKLYSEIKYSYVYFLYIHTLSRAPLRQTIDMNYELHSKRLNWIKDSEILKKLLD